MWVVEHRGVGEGCRDVGFLLQSTHLFFSESSPFLFVKMVKPDSNWTICGLALPVMLV